MEENILMESTVLVCACVRARVKTLSRLSTFVIALGLFLLCIGPSWAFVDKSSGSTVHSGRHTDFGHSTQSRTLGSQPIDDSDNILLETFLVVPSDVSVQPQILDQTHSRWKTMALIRPEVSKQMPPVADGATGGAKENSQGKGIIESVSGTKEADTVQSPVPSYVVFG